MVHDLMRGLSGTLFLFGGFNSGKSFTLFGDNREQESPSSHTSDAQNGDSRHVRGLIERCLHAVFQETTARVKASLFYMIHNKAWDLFSEESAYSNISSFIGKIPTPTIFSKFNKPSLLE